MATIMNILSRLGSNGTERIEDDRDSAVSLRPETNGSEKDIAAFEKLGEHQQSIASNVDLVIRDLDTISSLVEQLAQIKSELSRSFDSHRKLALDHSDLQKDKERVDTGLREKSAQNESLNSELKAARTSLEEINRTHSKARAELDALESRFHLLGVAKKDGDEQYQRIQSQLVAMQDEAASLEREAAGLREQNQTQSARISDLSEKYSEASNKCIFLTNRCEALELNLQEKISELVGLRELVEMLNQEKDSAVLYGRQKELDASQARSESTRLFQQAQQEKKAREVESSNLRIELDTMRSSVRTHEEMIADLRNQNDKLKSDLAHYEERTNTLSSSSNRREAMLARVTAKLESTSTARSQIEQSRAVMSTRLETLTQILSEREADVKRLEGALEQALAKSEEHAGRADDKIDALNNRVFELEKELSTSQNEAAFYSSQVEAMQRQPKRA
jgi:DNA repair exonuclease SbcCD ATPase subunit